ncbi:MAG TPA: uroporphyrinogen-III synthase [Chitinophagaceae bacterium]|nr:uroporphyrinogen-III synthase [Chitinophagaceae bacterium]
MQQNKVSILSTRPIDESLIEEAKRLNIEIDILSFIETEPIQTIEVLQEIEYAFLQSTAVVFTSMNAVEAVANELQDQHPDWRIYSIGNTTKQLVKKYFGEELIAGTANAAVDLAELIVQDRFVDEVIFFCGDQRRNELPDILRKNNIEVHEIVVYQTVAIPHKVGKNYHGILFFSPTAVDSFFSKNKVKEQTVLFAIGNTTANAIKKFSNNKIIISDEPGKDNLVVKMMEYFGGV